MADFSSVLLDLKDKEILSSKPIDIRTLNIASKIAWDKSIATV